jgi:quercetin dioxygenase-like cupin family protein
MEPKLYPNWKDIVVYSEQHPQPQILEENEKYKSVIFGLEAGAKIPPHAEGPSVFHFLEGTGRVIVAEETYAIQSGATVIVPDGAIRGIEAETRLAVLAVRVL